MDKKLTILIVDDNAVIRLKLKKILEKNNYTVIEAENGKSALHLIEKHIPDLVLLDLMMPVMDGESALKEIRSKFKIRELPVIIVTSNSDPVTLKNLIGLGCQDFIVKPFDYRVLITKVDAVFNDPLLNETVVHEKSQKYADKVADKLNTYFENDFISLVYDFLLIKNYLTSMVPKLSDADSKNKMQQVLKEIIDVKRLKSDLTRTISRSFDPTDDEVIENIIYLAKNECDRIFNDIKAASKLKKL